MITRLVKLSFDKKHAEEFSSFFAKIKDQIEKQPGCIEVKLYEYPETKGVFFTLSSWESEEHIQAYRKSELFGSVWPKVKLWMNDKPEAWSLNKIESPST